MATQNRLWPGSSRVRMVMSLSAVVVYVLLFSPAYALLGRSAIVLSLGPLLVIALLFELWGGLAIGLGLIPLNVLLYLLVEGPGITMPGTDFWLVHVVLLATGLLVGHMRDRRRRLEQQLAVRQVAERALQESESKYRNVVEQANDGIVIVQDGQMRYVSQQMAEMLGLEVADIVDRPFAPFVVPEHRALVQERYVRRQRGEQVPSRYESAFICADGSHIDVEINAGVMDYEGRPATLAVVRDVTARKAAESELRKLLQAVEQSAHAVVITDLDGQIEYANPRFAEMTGYSVEEALGQNPRLLQSGEHDKAYYEHLWGTILSGKAWRGEFHNRRKNGTLYWEEATIAPVQDGTGTITNFVAIKEDITERKEVADRLAERLQFEALLSELSAAFTGLTSDQYEVEIARWMQRVSESLGVDRSRLYRFNEESFLAESVYAYSADGAMLPASTVSRAEFPQVFDLVTGGEVFVASTPEDLPADAVEEKAFFEAQGIYAFLVVPLEAGGTILGALVFTSLKPQRNWPEDLIRRLRLVGEVFANALLRQQTEARLQRYAEQTQHDAQVKANLLQEVNHRVSNNLTAIIGLMRAERRYARSQNRAAVEAMVERLTRRVEGMVEVHRLLSQSQWMPVRLDRLAKQVVVAALGVLANEQSVEVMVAESDARVSPRQAGNLAMIFNELTTNTIKHAMAGRTEGRIEIRISAKEQIRVEYRDDGPAYPDAVLALEQFDVGLYLVQQLVLGLPGQLEFRNEGGAVTVIDFEVEEGDRT